MSAVAVQAVHVASTSDNLRNVYGRGMNTSSDEYKLPADKEEHDRLTIQHRVWVRMLGGLYPLETEDVVNRLLTPNESGSPPAVLDLGSGSGIWAGEMAAMFPHANVVGLDLAEPKLRNFPSNCSFVTADATKGLGAYTQHFDLVHCRCVAGHVSDRAGLVRSIATILKPGGLLLFADGNQHIYSSTHERLESADTAPNADNTGRSWMARWMDETVGRMNAKSPERIGGDHLAWFLQNEPQFEFIGAQPIYPPMGWNGGDLVNGDEAARLLEKNMLDFLYASKPLLLASGVPSDTVNKWLVNTRSDILEPPFPWCMKWDYAWAVKKATVEDHQAE